MNDTNENIFFSDELEKQKMNHIDKDFFHEINKSFEEEKLQDLKESELIKSNNNNFSNLKNFTEVESFSLPVNFF